MAHYGKLNGGNTKIDVPERTFFFHIQPVSMEHEELFQKILLRSFERLAAGIHSNCKDGGDKESFPFWKILSMYLMFQNYAKVKTEAASRVLPQ